MENFEEFIEVENDDLFLGDQHLKIGLPTLDEKKEKTETNKDDEGVTKKTKTPTTNDDDFIDTDDYLNSTEEEDETKEDTDEKVNTKSTNTKKDGKKDSKEKGEVRQEVLDETENSEAESLNEFSAFGSILAEKGFFPDVEDEELAEISSEDDLSDKLAKQLNITFNKWQDHYKQNLVNNLIKEGYISKDSVQNKESLVYDEEAIKGDINVAKEVIKRYYKRTGVPDKEIQRIINSREDLEESALELNSLNAELDKKEQQQLIARMKQQEEEAIRQREAVTTQMKQNTYSYEEFIPGRKLRPQEKEEVFLNIEPTLKKINNDLVKYAPLLAYLDKYGMLDGKFDKLIKEGKSQGVSSLQQILTDKKKSSGSSAIRKSGIINIDDSGVPSIYK